MSWLTVLKSQATGKKQMVKKAEANETSLLTIALIMLLSSFNSVLLFYLSLFE